MNTKKLFNKIIKIVLPLLLGSAILYWMYRGFDFSSISHVLLYELDVDDSLSSLWYSGAGFSWMEVEAESRTYRGTCPFIGLCQFNLPFLCR